MKYRCVETTLIRHNASNGAGAGAESSDTTLAEGQAALDGATRKTLCCASSETSLLGCLPDEGDI